MIRTALLSLVAATLLAACASETELGAPPPELASFRMGHVVVVSDNATQSPISRAATPEEWRQSLQAAVQERFGRLEGDTFYHFGIHVDGFALAPPGIPVVVSPKSVLIVSVTAFEDVEGGRKLHPEPKQITVFEALSGETVIGSGLTRTREEQMRRLSFNAARAIETWLLENPQWFDPTAVARPRQTGPDAM